MSIFQNQRTREDPNENWGSTMSIIKNTRDNEKIEQVFRQKKNRSNTKKQASHLLEAKRQQSNDSKTLRENHFQPTKCESKNTFSDMQYLEILLSSYFLPRSYWENLFHQMSEQANNQEVMESQDQGKRVLNRRVMGIPRMIVIGDWCTCRQ